MYDEIPKKSSNTKLIVTIMIVAAFMSICFFFIYVSISSIPDGYTKGKKLFLEQDYYGAISNFNIAKLTDNNNFDLYFQLGESYYNIENYNEAVDAFTRATEIDPASSSTKAWIASVYIDLEDYTKAQISAKEAISLNAISPAAYNVEGRAYYSNYEYEKAITDFEKAISLDKNYYDAYLNKLKTIYEEKNYDACISFSKTIILLFPKETNAYLYLADCLSQQSKHAEAITQLNLGLKLNANSPDLLTSLGWENLYLKDYTKARTLCDKALTLSPKLSDALALNDSINKDNKPEGEKIVDFIRTNYLYFNKVEDFETKAKAFEALKTVSSEDVQKFIDSIKIKNDPFTFTLIAKDFDHMVTEQNTPQVTSKNLDSNTVYIKINSFNESTDTEFKNFVAKISDTENKNIVIDLRGDTGGVIAASNNILDLLLPDCTASFTIDRVGTMKSFKSDAAQVKFKKIIVLVDDHTASSSELLTLGLRSYLNNVVVVGQETYGKGVGQKTYDDFEKKYSIFLVSFFWNVRQANIYGEGVFPDVTVGTSDSDYFNEVNKLVK